MKAKLDKAKVEDAEILKAMSVLAFTSDYEQYGFYPPGIESLDWHKSAIGKGHYYKISFEGEIAGGICVIPSVNNLIKIKYFFIADIYQNKSIGSSAMKLLEKKYSNARTWALVTPHKAYRNHHFYEKFGYSKVGEVQPDPNNEFKIFKYKKNREVIDITNKESTMKPEGITILDGGMGRELEKRGAPFKQPEWSAMAMMVAPEIVKEVHKAFIASGASVIMTNSYALVPFHIGEKKFKDQGMVLATCAGEMARAAVNETETSTRVAGSIPPLFGSYRADLYRSERVVEIATPLIEGLRTHVDLWLCETQSLIDEPVRIKSLVDHLDKQNKPFWVSFTLEDSQGTNEPLLRSGETVEDAVKAMVDVNVDAILFNCCQPEVIGQAVKTTQQQLASLGAQNIEIGAYANTFPPLLKDVTANEGLSELRTDLTPIFYLDWARQWIEDGATLIGGCCGIGPEHIAVLSENLA